MRATQMVRRGLSGLFVLVLAVAVGCSGTKTAGLDSRHPLVRKAAATRLGETGDMSVYNDLVAALRTDPDRLVRSQAAFAIGELNKRYYSIGFYPLTEALEHDSSVFVRAASALSLSAVKDARAVAPLVTALRDDERGEAEVMAGDKVIVYKVSAADAARTSLERLVGLQFASRAITAGEKRSEIASQWEDWYEPRIACFPTETAVASQ